MVGIGKLAYLFDRDVDKSWRDEGKMSQQISQGWQTSYTIQMRGKTRISEIIEQNYRCRMVRLIRSRMGDVGCRNYMVVRGGPSAGCGRFRRRGYPVLAAVSYFGSG